ncbi:hypothetical protein Lal_00015311 [Lupinus albus]|nr:hypothetical protein Lal_00015311 [Lupinus albus]
MERNERLLLRFAAETTPELLRLGSVMMPYFASSSFSFPNDDAYTNGGCYGLADCLGYKSRDKAAGLSVDLP